MLGTYFLEPNQPGPGSHVCNCGYAVAPDAQGKGVAYAMCEHSQREAVGRGFPTSWTCSRKKRAGSQRRAAAPRAAARSSRRWSTTA